MQNNTATKDGMIVACVKHAERALVDAERDFSLSDCPMVQQYHSGRIHALHYETGRTTTHGEQGWFED
jgi:hypothetical protein